MSVPGVCPMTTGSTVSQLLKHVIDRHTIMIADAEILVLIRINEILAI